MKPYLYFLLRMIPSLAALGTVFGALLGVVFRLWMERLGASPAFADSNVTFGLFFGAFLIGLPTGVISGLINGWTVSRARRRGEAVLPGKLALYTAGLTSVIVAVPLYSAALEFIPSAIAVQRPQSPAEISYPFVTLVALACTAFGVWLSTRVWAGRYR